jgi:hypothetical protein
MALVKDHPTIVSKSIIAPDDELLQEPFPFDYVAEYGLSPTTNPDEFIFSIKVVYEMNSVGRTLLNITTNKKYTLTIDELLVDNLVPYAVNGLKEFLHQYVILTNGSHASSKSFSEKVAKSEITSLVKPLIDDYNIGEKRI